MPISRLIQSFNLILTQISLRNPNKNPHPRRKKKKQRTLAIKTYVYHHLWPETFQQVVMKYSNRKPVNLYNKFLKSACTLNLQFEKAQTHIATWPWGWNHRQSLWMEFRGGVAFFDLKRRIQKMELKENEHRIAGQSKYVWLRSPIQPQKNSPKLIEICKKV